MAAFKSNRENHGSPLVRLRRPYACKIIASLALGSPDLRARAKRSTRCLRARRSNLAQEWRNRTIRSSSKRFISICVCAQALARNRANICTNTSFFRKIAAWLAINCVHRVKTVLHCTIHRSAKNSSCAAALSFPTFPLCLLQRVRRIALIADACQDRPRRGEHRFER